MPRSDPPRRIVALGASNLTRMLPRLVDLARRRAGAPVDVLAAAGFGRSFGAPSRFLWRGLPGIDACGLWRELAAAPRCPTLAIVCDVGNDVLYGHDVARILGWIDRALDRLAPHATELAIAGLPVQRLDAVGPLRYAFVRTLVVPGCPVPRATALYRAAALDAALRERAARRGARFVVMDPGWYGFDPIHVRRRRLVRAARALLGLDAAPPPTVAAPARVADRIRVRLARAAERSRFGIRSIRAQPSARLADGSTLSLY
ncbi:MAG: hypothetical protein IPM29_26660 [Planctomycetes bacterium]|nr:hypothetical protein [Planctomycetota bacterium]